MDYSYWGIRAELLYESQACGYDLFNLCFCNLCWFGCSDLTYCDHCFACNESVAQEQVPLTKDEVLAKGWRWHDEYEEKKRGYIGPRIELPDDSAEAEADLSKKILCCERTGRPYKILSAELDYYRKQRIPLPRVCPDVRHARRLTLRNPRILWERKCLKCDREILTSYAPARPERVHCEKCYYEAVYG